MLEEICIIFMTILTCSLAFNLSCPGSGQWNFRAIFYCSDLDRYICLLDTSKTRYTETCDGPRDEVEGYKSTINRNNFDTAKCRPDRFQPKDFITVGNSDCVFQKSKCAQEGQIAAHEIKEKTSLLDTNCLCDYTKGYSFINLPKDKCFCSPLVDDCSCFREVCPSGEILSPDYQCTTQIDMKNRKWNCSKIASANDSQNGDQVQQSIKDIDPKNERRSRIAVQVIVPILVSIMTGLLIWCWKTSKLDKVKERIIRLATLSRLSSDSIASDHENCLSTEEIKFLQTDDQTIDLISQTNQNDTPVPEHDGTVSDNQSFKSTYESMTGINEIEENKSVTYNSTGPITKSEISKPVFQNGDKGVSRTFAKEQKDKRDDPVEETCTVVVENEKTSTKQHEEKSDGPGEEICTDEAKNNTIKENRELNTSKKEHLDKSDGSNDDICIDKAENILKIQENEELNTSEEDHIDDSDAKKFDTDNKKPFEQDNTDQSDESDAKKSDTDNKKPSEQDNTDQSDELDAKKSDTDNKKPSEEDHIDESYAKKFDTDNTKLSDQYNTDHSDESDAKGSDTDNKKLSKSGTDNQDKRVNTETPNVTENATEENFDILLKGLEESKHESVDSGSDEIFDSKNPKSND